PLEDLVTQLRSEHGLVVSFSTRLARAREILEEVEVDRLQRDVMNTRQLAVVAQREGAVALLRREEGLRVPLGQGWGEDACRRVLRACFGGAHAQVRLLGTSPGFGTRPALEVWLAEGAVPSGQN